MLDGQNAEVNISSNTEPFNLNLTNKVYRIGHKGDRPMVYHGMLTEVYLWSKALTFEEMSIDIFQSQIS